MQRLQNPAASVEEAERLRAALAKRAEERQSNGDSAATSVPAQPADVVGIFHGVLVHPGVHYLVHAVTPTFADGTNTFRRSKD